MDVVNQEFYLKFEHTIKFAERMETEAYEINLAGEKLSVQEHSDDSYTIAKEGKRLAVIYAVEDSELGTIWKSDDDVNSTFVSQVGELILERNM